MLVSAAVRSTASRPVRAAGCAASCGGGPTTPAYARRGGSAPPLPSAATTATRAATSSGVASPLTTREERSLLRLAARLAHQRGMFPCFFAGSVSRLERSSRSARTISTRVSCGLITAST